MESNVWGDVRDERLACAYVKDNGEQCRVPVRPGKARCLWHCECEECKAKREAARRRGGQQAQVLLQLRKQQALVTTSEGLEQLRDRVLREVSGGELDPDAARVTLYEISQRMGSRSNGTGHESGYQRAERELGELLEQLNKGKNVKTTVNGVRDGCRLTRHFAEGRSGRPKDLRDGCVLDYFVMAIAQDVGVGLEPALGRWSGCTCKPEGEAKRVLWCACPEARGPAKVYPQTIDRADVIDVCAEVMGVNSREMESRFELWDREWLKAKRR